jgi:outer membrane protein assembly factor BamB
VLLLLGLALAGCGLRGASKPAAAPAGGRPSAAPARRSGSVASTATGGSVSGSTGSGGAAGTVQAPATPAPRPGPLPYPILIADRGNSRIMEVTPGKRIVWEFPAPGGLPPGQSFVGGDDSFFTPGGGQIISNEEHNGTIAIIGYATKRIVWQYGHPGVEDWRPGFLDYPDDAYMLSSGLVVVADIRNCRVLFINPEKQVVQQWGHHGNCTDQPPRYLSSPNGDTPLPGGDILVTEINGAAGHSRVVRLHPDGQVVWNVPAPHILYGSDAQLLADGDVLIADYSRPGRLVIFNPSTGHVDWEYAVPSGPGMLDHPSLALPLPNGDILVTDDYRDRVVVIDRASKKIVWQYGHTDTPGTAPGFLNIPDGADVDVYHAVGGG